MVYRAVVQKAHDTPRDPWEGWTVTPLDLRSTLRALLPRLDPEPRRLAEAVLADPNANPFALWDHADFMGPFEEARQEATPVTLADLATWEDPWTHGQHCQTFYVPKPSVAEQNAGLEDLPATQVTKFGPAKLLRQNTHPTPKPVTLMRHLVVRACPVGGTVLDPFAGSGTTGIACVYEGRRFIGVEREAPYLEIAKRRMAHAERLARTSS